MLSIPTKSCLKGGSLLLPSTTAQSLTQAASCPLIAVTVTQGEHWEITQLCCFCCLLQRKTKLAWFLMVSLIASKQFLTSFGTCFECFFWFPGYTSAKADSFRGHRWGSHAWRFPVQDCTSHLWCFKSGTFTLFFYTSLFYFMKDLI